MTRVVRPAPGPARRLRPAAGRGQPRAGARAGRARLAGGARPVRAVPGRGRPRGPWPAHGSRTGEGVILVLDRRSADQGDRLLRLAQAARAATSATSRSRATRAWWCSRRRRSTRSATTASGPRRSSGSAASRARSTTATATRWPPGWCSVPEMLRQTDDVLLNLIRHEFAHVAIGQRDRRLPLWIVEGLAEWASLARRHDLPDRDVRGAGRRGRATGSPAMPSDDRVPQRRLRARRTGSRGSRCAGSRPTTAPGAVRPARRRGLGASVPRPGRLPAARARLRRHRRRARRAGGGADRRHLRGARLTAAARGVARDASRAPAADVLGWLA